MNENGQTKTPCICIAKNVSLLLYYIYTDNTDIPNNVPHHIYMYNTEAEQIKPLNDTPPNNRKELIAIQIKFV